MKQLFVFVILLFRLIYTLPVTVNTTQEPQLIQVDRLSHLIATHIQFDHLDTVISSTDKAISKEFQNHIQINIESNSKLPTLDVMDLEILKSQIFAAIQAHTEGNLPLTWDKLSHSLSKQSIEFFIHNLLISTCGLNKEETVQLSCLEEHSSELSSELDKYITENFEKILDTLDNEILPNLLEHTTKDLKGVLNYFNLAFLNNEKMQFVLDILPWDKSNLKVSAASCEQLHFLEFASMATM